MKDFRIGMLAAAFALLALAVAGCGGSSGSGSSVAIDNVTPSSFSSAGHVTLTITGHGFVTTGTLSTAELIVSSGDASPYLIGTSNVNIISDTRATVFVPADEPGTTPVYPLSTFAAGQSNIELELVWSAPCTSACPDYVAADSPVIKID